MKRNGVRRKLWHVIHTYWLINEVMFLSTGEKKVVLIFSRSLSCYSKWSNSCFWHLTCWSWGWVGEVVVVVPLLGRESESSEHPANSNLIPMMNLPWPLIVHAWPPRARIKMEKEWMDLNEREKGPISSSFYLQFLC